MRGNRTGESVLQKRIGPEPGVLQAVDITPSSERHSPSGTNGILGLATFGGFSLLEIKKSDSRLIGVESLLTVESATFSDGENGK